MRGFVRINSLIYVPYLHEVTERHYNGLYTLVYFESYKAEVEVVLFLNFKSQSAAAAAPVL